MGLFFPTAKSSFILICGIIPVNFFGQKEIKATTPNTVQIHVRNGFIDSVKLKQSHCNEIRVLD